MSFSIRRSFILMALVGVTACTSNHKRFPLDEETHALVFGRHGSGAQSDCDIAASMAVLTDESSWEFKGVFAGDGRYVVASGSYISRDSYLFVTPLACDYHGPQHLLAKVVAWNSLTGVTVLHVEDPTVLPPGQPATFATSPTDLPATLRLFGKRHAGTQVDEAMGVSGTVHTYSPPEPGDVGSPVINDYGETVGFARWNPYNEAAYTYLPFEEAAGALAP